MATVTKTVEEVYNALVKNGFEHLRGEWISYLDGKLAGGCALGQTAINLGVFAYSPFEDDLYTAGVYLDWANKYWKNDNSGWKQTKPKVRTIANELDKFEVSPSSPWFTGEDAGGTIMGWNDAIDWNADAEGRIYKLKTYQEVAQMAYDVLSPHFKKKVTLTVFDYEND